MAKREPITKKLRFEVFKRDSFTCQYCGGKAPETVLHLDHIKPVAKGGGNGICNLITSCQPCNSGKKDRLLTENQSIDKMRIQAEMLQERREQLEMMMDWVDGLRDIDSMAIDGIDKSWSSMVGYSFTSSGRVIIKKHIKKYGYAMVSAAMETSVSQYVKHNDEGEATSESVMHAFNKIGAICYHKKLIEDDPVYGELFELNRVLSRRLSYHNWRLGLELLKKADASNVSMSSLHSLVSSVKNWSEFRAEIEAFCEKCEEGDE